MTTKTFREPEHEEKKRSSSSADPMNAAAEMFQAFSKNMKLPEVDREFLINNHKKNMEAMNEANKMAIEVLKSIAQLQTQYTRQTFEDMTRIVQELNSSSKNHQWNAPNHTNHIRDMMVRAFDHSNQVSGIVARSGQQLYGDLQERFNENGENTSKPSNKKKH
jgi:hypothetical protein